MTATEIELAQGLWRDGVFHRTGVVAPLTGWAECGLRDSLATRPANAEAMTRLLAVSVGGIGAVSPLTPDDTADLTVGDRERLLFGLCRASFGPHVELTATCPRCGEVSELQIVAEAAAPPLTEPTLLHYADYDSEGHGWRISCRLPTGRDQAELAAAAADDIGRAERLLLRRCVVKATRDGEPVLHLEPDAAMLAAFEEAVRLADPAAEGGADFACSACGARSGILIDAATILRGALMDGRGILLDVHRLARAYHWPERDILDLAGTRRRDYLALIDEEAGA